MATEFTNFPVLESDFFTPKGLYQEIFPRFSNPRNEVYWGGPASSGGARRLIDPEKQVDVQRSLLVIGLNSIFANLLAEKSADLFTGQNLTLAHRVGKSLEPREFNYNLYWLFHLTGVSPWFADQFAAIANRPDIIASINDQNAGKGRELAYFRLSDLFFEMVANIPELTLNPVSAVVFLPDHRTSFGCRLEKRTIIRLREFGFNIPMYEAAINLASPETKLSENALLIEAYSYIQSHGQIRLNGASFNPPFIYKQESKSLIELIPLAEDKNSRQESLFTIKNGVAIRIAAWRERLKAADGFGPLVADFPAETKFEVHGGIITMGNLKFEPENLAAALLEATIIDGRAIVRYPLVQSGGMKLILFAISTGDINGLLSACL